VRLTATPAARAAERSSCTPRSRVYCKSYRYLGVRTNNEAEYEALLMALRRAHAFGFRQVELRSSSELLVNQLLCTYSVRSVASGAPACSACTTPR
jgi:ribonuclease HI